MEEPAGLYLHIPFCAQKCGYCDFYSLPADGGTRAAYVRRLCAMLAETPFGPQRFSTIYFGGGTPSLLTPAEIGALLETARRCHSVEDGECTLECNPGSVSAEFFRAVAAAGVNRISLGLQSADPALLRLLGRRHTAGDVRRAAAWAREAGIVELSLDVMLALPGQTEEQVLDTLRLCYGCDAGHISAYLLKVEPGTPFARRGIEALCPDADRQADLYLLAARDLQAHGYVQYEISNFCKPGHESRHNLGYWQGRPYLGLGPSAHSLMGGRRMRFGRSLPEFLTAEDPWALLRDDGAGGGPEEYVMLRLRLREGLDLREAEARFALDADALLRRARPFETAGLLRIGEGRISCTAEGFLVSNALIAELLEETGDANP